MTQLVRYESDGIVSTIIMDDGKANVLSPSMLRELNAAVDRAEAENTVVLLAGRAGMFSCGFDLAVFKRSRAEQLEMLLGGARTALRLLAFPAPVILACSGHAVAMGAFLLLSADVRIGVRGAEFQICVKEVEIGMTLPRFAVEICRQRLSPPHFHLATITARQYNPEEAREAGFVDELMPAASLMDAACEQARVASKLNRAALIASKLRVRQSALDALRNAIAADEEEWRTRSS
jgi:enoyl-CoA hydratase